MGPAIRKARPMIEAAAYVLSNCGASVPASAATKLHFTSACDEAALRAQKSARVPIWAAVEQPVLPRQVVFELVPAAWPAVPPVLSQRSPPGLPGQGRLVPP
jgi:hypothetical protein